MLGDTSVGDAVTIRIRCLVRIIAPAGETRHSAVMVGYQPSVRSPDAKTPEKSTTKAPISINCWTRLLGELIVAYIGLCALSLSCLRRRRSIRVPPTDAIPLVNSVCVVTPERRHTMDNGNVTDTKITERASSRSIGGRVLGIEDDVRH